MIALRTSKRSVYFTTMEEAYQFQAEIANASIIVITDEQFLKEQLDAEFDEHSDPLA